MKLYYSPGACSLAPHIVLRETGSRFALERVDLPTHKLANGTDYYSINPKGAVPLLELEGGERLSEGPVICQYLADKAGNTQLLPAVGTLQRYRVAEWQGYINSELHKSFSPMFGAPPLEDSAKAAFAQALQKKFKWVSDELQGKQYLIGDNCTIADIYLFVVAGWAKHVKLDLAAAPNVLALVSRVAERPAVKEALRVEGLS